MDRDHEFTLRSIEYKAVEDIKRKWVDIGKAIPDLKESHGLTFCQVWVLRTVENENEQSVVKYGGFYIPGFKAYYKACVKIEDGLGGVAVKALETYKTYFSRNIMKGDLQALIPAATSASESSYCCLGICLRNIETGNYDYAFELCFSSYEYNNNNNNNNNPCVFLESLFLKLESCLPGFEFSSGLQLGRQLLVMDVDNPTEIFKILASKKQEKEEDCERRLLQRCINVSFGISFNRSKVEIQKALSFLTESHGLALCQVWIYHYPLSKKNERAVKLDGYCAAGFKDYYDACVNIGDGAGGLALTTRVTGQPYFSRNINTIIKGKLHELLPFTESSHCCCFAICLRNIHTGNVDYAFELLFSLHDNIDPYVFLESLLVKLETCFPSFKLASGARLGRELQVLDGDNLAVNFNITAFIKQEDFEAPPPCNATNHVMSWMSMDIGGTTKVMDVSSSMKFADLKMKISKKFRLVSGAYRVSYLVKNGGSTGPSLWRQIQDDRDLNNCIRLCKRNRKTRFLIRVLPCTIILNEGGGVHTRVPEEESTHEYPNAIADLTVMILHFSTFMIWVFTV
ncbi:uncharacterized protein [Rutidosis leptorrhynchoides]|uniref:uncharacterized protein n=1 Tax=Rutidosis leptorrhynchoides TaxID=125765 RepID=UPI003A9A0377